MNLEQFVNQKVTVKYRNNFVETGTLLRAQYSLDYPYIFGNHFYTKRGEILIDKLDKYDIVSIQPTEELKMTEINYKKLAEELYDAFKQTFDNKTERQIAILQKYEQLHKPKMTFTGYITGKKFAYNNRDYAIINRFWYRVQSNILTYIEDMDLVEDLNSAYLEWEERE